MTSAWPPDGTTEPALSSPWPAIGSQIQADNPDVGNAVAEMTQAFFSPARTGASGPGILGEFEQPYRGFAESSGVDRYIVGDQAIGGRRRTSPNDRYGDGVLFDDTQPGLS